MIARRVAATIRGLHLPGSLVRDAAGFFAGDAST